MAALQARASAREFPARKLDSRVLSNLLWAACGINRPDGRRTAPTSHNWQEIDVYAALEEGLYLYDPKAHKLSPVAEGDHRAAMGTQDYVGTAAANLVYVAGLARMAKATGEDKTVSSAADTGFISQNVYLYCASEGLATVVRAGVDREAPGKIMRLRPEQRIILAQSVGYPKAPVAKMK
jgi:nitroreductase